MRLQQTEAGSENVLGELVVSVGYIKEMSAIEVNVVQARDTGIVSMIFYICVSQFFLFVP